MMRRYPFLLSFPISLLPLFFISCNGEEPMEEETTEEVACGLVKYTDPMDGETDVPIVEFTYEVFFSEPVEEASMEISGDGYLLHGTSTLSEEGDYIVFTTEETLSVNSAYSVEVEYPDCIDTFTFETGELGTALSPGIELAGNTYLLDLRGAEIVEPPDVGDLLKEEMENLLMAVTEVSETSITFLGAVPDEDEEGNIVQDTCQPTVEFPEGDFSESPHFSIGPTFFQFEVDDSVISIEELFISGIFSSDGSYFGYGVFDGSIDTRNLEEVFDIDEGYICELLSVMTGEECRPCPDDGEPLCMDFRAEHIHSGLLEGVTVIPVESPCS